MADRSDRLDPVPAATAAGVMMLVTFLWAPVPVRTVMLGSAAVGMPLAVLLGIRVHRPPRAGVWYSLAACGTVWGCMVLPLPLLTSHLVGDVMVRDLGILVGYLVLIAGVLRATRRVTSDRPVEVAVDVTIFALGCVSVVWAFTAERGTIHGVSATIMASPFLDVVAFTSAARLVLVAGGAVSPALLLACLGMLTLGDIVNLQLEHLEIGGAQPGSFFFVAAYVAAGLAALHPSMARFGSRSASGVAHLERTHLTALALASFLPPLMLLRQGNAPTTVVATPLLAMAAITFTLVMVRLQRTMGVVDKQRVQLESLARTDHLTSLPNRRTGEAELRRMVEEAMAQRTALVVALLDLDHFKAYNDRHGHPAGDRLLETTAGAWRRSLPPDVFLSRHGGEEFLLLAKGRHPDNVRLLLEGLRGAGQTGQTFSAGVAVWDGVEPIQSLLNRADQALYGAKNGGRDQVRFAVHRPVVLTPAGR